MRKNKCLEQNGDSAFRHFALLRAHGFFANLVAMKTWLETAKRWAKGIKRDVLALWIAARDPRTPFSAKFVAGAVAAYALSPIDLIPDFIPVIGYLDDLLIVPLGILFAVRLVPPSLMVEFRNEALRRTDRPAGYGGLVAVVLLWIAASALAGWFFWSYLMS